MLPILGKDSRLAAQVALAAQRQAKYESFHSAMMAANGPTDQKTILAKAAEVGLDLDQVNADVQAVEINDAIERNLGLAQGLAIRGTPAFVIDNEIVFGAIDLATMKQKIAAARRSKSGGVGGAANPDTTPAANVSHEDWRG